MNPKVDDYLSSSSKWQQELALLRELVLECGLIEEFKWRQPCYTYQGKNVLVLSRFKEYCAVNLFKGALLGDKNQILVQQTENVQAGRQLRFTNTAEINDLAVVIKSYVFEAIEIEKAGLAVPVKKTSDFEVPEEFQNKLAANPELKSAYEALTPGRQKGYLLFFAGAKQSKTREARIEKYTQRIMDGYGFHDCICGLSKKMPNCDGSHKSLE